MPKTNQTAATTAKKWWKSTTLWINLAAAVTDTVVSVVSDYGTGGVVTGLSVLNMAIRTFTKSSLTR